MRPCLFGHHICISYPPQASRSAQFTRPLKRQRGHSCHAEAHCQESSWPDRIIGRSVRPPDKVTGALHLSVPVHQHRKCSGRQEVVTLPSMIRQHPNALHQAYPLVRFCRSLRKYPVIDLHGRLLGIDRCRRNAQRESRRRLHCTGIQYCRSRVGKLNFLSPPSAPPHIQDYYGIIDKEVVVT